MSASPEDQASAFEESILLLISDMASCFSRSEFNKKPGGRLPQEIGDRLQ
jgi:hypothetical protein